MSLSDPLGSFGENLKANTVSSICARGFSLAQRNTKCPFEEMVIYAGHMYDT